MCQVKRIAGRINSVPACLRVRRGSAPRLFATTHKTTGLCNFDACRAGLQQASVRNADSRMRTRLRYVYTRYRLAKMSTLGKPSRSMSAFHFGQGAQIATLAAVEMRIGTAQPVRLARAERRRPSAAAIARSIPDHANRRFFR